MDFYNIENNKINKYLITIKDIEKLTELKQEIIDNCSRIIHYDKNEYQFETEYREKNNLPYREIRNYSENFTGTYGGDGELIVHEPINHVIYNEYQYPFLVIYLNNLLENNDEYLSNIFNPDFNNELKTVDEELEELKLKINNIDNNDKNKIDLIRDFDKLLQIKQFNKKQVSVRKYYPKVINLITTKLIASKDLDDVVDILDFANVNYDNKVLKLIKNNLK